MRAALSIRAAAMIIGGVGCTTLTKRFRSIRRCRFANVRDIRRQMLDVRTKSGFSVIACSEFGVSRAKCTSYQETSTWRMRVFHGTILMVGRNAKRRRA
jgi:hypothetical protein